MKCPDCGAENIEGAAYCEDCGSKLAVSAGGVVPVQPPQQVVSAAPAQDQKPQVPQEATPAVLPGGKCGSCGAENHAGEAFCEDCGASLGTAAVQVQVEQAPQTQVTLPPAPQLNIAKLTVIASNKEFSLNKDEITIGRRSPADGIYPDVDLTDDDTESYVSRRHAQIIKQGGQYIFEDVGSANGSFINNVRMSKGTKQELKDNDQLRLGKTEMLFKLPVA